MLSTDEKKYWGHWVSIPIDEIPLSLINDKPPIDKSMLLIFIESVTDDEWKLIFDFVGEKSQQNYVDRLRSLVDRLEKL